MTTQQLDDTQPEESVQADLSPGQILKQLREQKGLSIEVVSEATKISLNNIRAIEEEEFEHLPADTFVRGLITLYANFLGIEGADLARQFLARRHQSSSPDRWRRKKLPSTSLAPKKLAEPAHVSSATVALVLLILIVVSFTGFCIYTSWNPFSFLTARTRQIQDSMQSIFLDHNQEDTSTLPPETKNDERATAENRDASEGTQPIVYNLQARFLRDTAVEIIVDGAEPQRREFRKGDTASWEGVHRIRLSFDQPQAATLTLDGSALTFPQPDHDGHAVITLPDDLLDQ